MKLFIVSLMIALASSMAVLRNAAKSLREAIAHGPIPPQNNMLALQRAQRAMIRAAKRPQREASAKGVRINLMGAFNDAAGIRVVTPDSARGAKVVRNNLPDNGLITPETSRKAAKKASGSGSKGPARRLFDKK